MASRSVTASSCGRWLFNRCKRAICLAVLLLGIFLLVTAFFVAVNQDHAQLSGLRAKLQGGGGLGPEIVFDLEQARNRRQHDRRKLPEPNQRPMVQFYPDNQDKSLFRKRPSKSDNLGFAQDDSAGRVLIPDGHSAPLSKPDRGYGNTYQDRIKAKLLPKTAKVDEEDDGVGANIVVAENSVTSEADFPLKNVSYDVHIFYYAWYGSPDHDGRYFHWNHEYLENWNKNDHRPMPSGKHNPDLGDIGANFYPELGPYSSKDPAVIAKHMKMIRKSGAGVIAVSWYPPGLADPNGPPVDQYIPTLLNAASKEGLKLALHIEPYKGRSPQSLRANVEYILKTYGDHPAFYRRQGMPLFYIYDSYLTPAKEWQRLLSPKGEITVRNTELDAIFIGLVVEYKHRNEIKAAGFDGFYTYFASNGFSHGSSWKNWRSLQTFARKASLIFIPSLGN